MSKQRIKIGVVLAALLLMLSGCGFGTGQQGANDRVSVVCTLFPQMHLAQIIGGDAIQVRMLAASGTDGHAYEPTPADMIALSDAALFLYIGGEGEVWVQNVLDALGEDAPDSLALLSCAGEKLITSEAHRYKESHQAEHSDPGVLYDEHIWTSPVIYMEMARSVCAALSEKIPQEKENFEQRTQAYLQKLSDLDAQYRQIAKEAQQHTLVFGDEFPFRYLFEEYGFSYRAALHGCGEDTEPSAAEIAELIDFIKNNQIAYVFCLSDSSHQIAQLLCEETGAQVLTLHACHTLKAEEIAQKKGYLSLMEENAQKIRVALGLTTECEP